MKRILEKAQIHLPKIWLLVILSIAITLLIIANYCGLGFTYDSYLFMEIAEQISNDGFLATQGFNIKPPLYPLLIYWFGSESIFAINLVCFLITFLVLYRFGLVLKTKTIRFLFWGILLFSTPLYLVHSFAWTEAPFICVLLLAFYGIYSYQMQGKSSLLYISIILLFILPFIRFAGIFILMPTCMVLMLDLSNKHKWILAGIFSLGTIAFSIWIFQFEDGFEQRWHTFVGPFSRFNYSRYTHNIDSYLEAFSIWIVPLSIYKPIRIFFAIIALSIIGIYSINCFRKRRNILRSGMPIIFLCYYFLLHFVFEVEYYSAERYLTPLYNLLILSLLIWLDQRFAIIGKMAKKIILFFLFVFLIYNATRTIKNVFFWNHLRCVENQIQPLP